MSSSEEFNQTFAKFQQMYESCLEMLNRGIEFETSNEEMALKTYKDTIELIDKAMMIPIAFPELSEDDSREELKRKIKDLKRIIYNFKMQRSELLLRIGTIFRRTEEAEARKISKIKGQEETSRIRTFSELESVLQEIGKVEKSDSQSNILEILFCCDNVHLYYIEHDGEVVSSLEQFVLRIIKLGRDFEKNLDETIFMQLIKTADTSVEMGKEVQENGEASDEPQVDPSFVYPLIPGVSPLFRTKFNAFIMPDLQSNDCSAIGMIIPPFYDEMVLDILIAILKGVVKENGDVEFGDLTKIGDSLRLTRSTGDAVSENIITGAYWVSQGLVYGATKTGELIDWSTPHILSRIQKAPEYTPPVSERVNTTVTVAKSLTGYAAQGTGYLAEKVGGAMSSFGKFLAPHVQQQGARLLTYAAGLEESKAENTMKETLKIASGASEAISTIYSGLETSASILGRNLADNSVKLVCHKYGESYGEVSSKSFDTVGNLIAVNRTFNLFTPKGLVKSTAKSAGKGILNAEEFKPKVYMNKDYLTGSTRLYPNLDNFEREVFNKPKI